jgi:hypothetical protein
MSALGGAVQMCNGRLRAAAVKTIKMAVEESDGCMG